MTNFCSGSKCVSKEITFIFTCLVKWIPNILRIDMLGITLGRCLLEIIEGEFLRHYWRVVGVGKYLFEIAEGDGNVGWIGWSGLELNWSEENAKKLYFFHFLKMWNKKNFVNWPRLSGNTWMLSALLNYVMLVVRLRFSKCFIT